MPDVEIEAMGKLADALSELEEDARARVLRWAAERYGVETLQPRRHKGRTGGPSERVDLEDEDDEDGGNASSSTGAGNGGGQQFEHFAEFYDAVDPSNDPERVLVAAYWTQVHLGKSTFGSQELNKLLKDLGHGITAINKALLINIMKKPALMLQVSRGGNSQQARKKTKLTEAGLKWVRSRLDA
jgi:hypothetical protein